ncbi:MAG TPA: HAD hydrolase-like protein [Gaiellaceae bacterium]|nr:HAD hydrolase-like protein [Gaiellaceae bacterium]
MQRRGQAVRMVVLWDSLGTLLDVEPVRERFPGWLERVLHHGAALTLLGEFAPFDSLGAAADGEALRALQTELRPHDDVAATLDSLDEAGVRSWVVTNGGRESTERALGDLALRFEGIVSIEDVQAWKPARPPYLETLRRAGAGAAEACLIAAHAWDVHAAVRHGLRAVWVDRLEQEWQLPGEPPELRASTLPEAARLASRP